MAMLNNQRVNVVQHCEITLHKLGHGHNPSEYFWPHTHIFIHLWSGTAPPSTLNIAYFQKQGTPHLQPTCQNQPASTVTLLPRRSLHLSLLPWQFFWCLHELLCQEACLMSLTHEHETSLNNQYKKNTTNSIHAASCCYPNPVVNDHAQHSPFWDKLWHAHVSWLHSADICWPGPPRKWPWCQAANLANWLWVKLISKEWMVHDGTKNHKPFVAPCGSIGIPSLTHSKWYENPQVAVSQVIQIKKTADLVILWCSNHPIRIPYDNMVKN